MYRRIVPMRLFAAVLLWSVMGVASAADPLAGWYAGASAGLGKVDITKGDWDDGTLTNTTLDNETLTMKAFAGYHFTPHVAVEFSYIHFGDVKFSGVESNAIGTIWQLGNVHGIARVKGVSVAAVLSKSFFHDRFGVFVKGGSFAWTTTHFSEPTVAGGTLALGNERTVHDDGISFLFGGGAELKLYDKWHIRLEWEHSSVGFFQGTINSNVDFPSLGVTRDL